MIGVSIAPLALTGRVWLPNGVPPPEAVLIEYSGTSGTFEVWTDVHGRFSIPVEKFALPPPGARVELMLYLAAIPNADDASDIPRSARSTCARRIGLPACPRAEGALPLSARPNVIAPQP
jgi:hypothetical protein